MLSPPLYFSVYRYSSSFKNWKVRYAKYIYKILELRSSQSLNRIDHNPVGLQRVSHLRLSPYPRRTLEISFYPFSSRFGALLTSLLPFVEEPRSTRAPAAAIPNCFFRWAILRQKYYGRNNVILGRNERWRWMGVGARLPCIAGTFPPSLSPSPPCTVGILFRRISRESFWTQHFAADKSWL